MPADDRPPLFAWLEQLFLATGRGDVTRQEIAVAGFIALASRGTTGEDAAIDAARLAHELGRSERQVWRLVQAIVAKGWLVKTQLPTRGERGRPGRRARYRLTVPSVGVSGETSADRPTLTRPDVSHDLGAAPESSDSSEANRLTVLATSPDTAKRADVTVLPSVGSPSVGPPSRDRVRSHADRIRRNLRDQKTDRPDVDRLCAHLADRIEANGSPRPHVGPRWRDAARLLLDRDGRTEDDVHKAIDWCQADEFWRSNVLSMPKLREQYDRLRLQAQRRAAPPRGQQATDDLFERARARMNDRAQETQ